MRPVTTETAEQLLVKLRAFAATLDEEERALLGALVAPAVARAHPPVVEGFEAVRWSPLALPEALVAALRAGGWDGAQAD